MGLSVLRAPFAASKLPSRSWQCAPTDHGHTSPSVCQDIVIVQLVELSTHDHRSSLINPIDFSDEMGRKSAPFHFVSRQN